MTSPSGVRAPFNASETVEDLLRQIQWYRDNLSPDPDQRVYDLEQVLALARELQVRQKAPPKSPHALAGRALADIVERIQNILWLDQDEGGDDAWNRDKEWDSGTAEDVANVLIEAGLRPERGLA